ncbi:MAG: glycosyltransferase family 87 protein [Terriglobia bacterium]|nr:glycosyltransferase family 87 protein [Terriglobia bacterium]
MREALGGVASSDLTMYAYLPNVPTAVSVILPFAFMPVGPAIVTWLIALIFIYILGSFLMWNIGAQYQPDVSGGLIFLVLSSSELILMLGNAAGLAIGLCIIAVWCFYKERFVVAGIGCFALSLLIKPHDTGLIWLFFLLSGGMYRRRAIQVFTVAFVAAIPMVLWMSHIAPNWIQELTYNLSLLSAIGGMNDPSPATSAGRGIGMIISLQSVFSAFYNSPHIYNFLAFLTCAPILLILAYSTVRTKATSERIWLGLASIAPLTMLPVYHREYDAKLLLLAIPACAMLFARGGFIGKLSLLLTTLGILLTGDIPWAVFFAVLSKMHVAPAYLPLLNAVEAFPQPLILLAMSIFYLWVYMRYDPSYSLIKDQDSSLQRPTSSAIAES